LDPDVAVGLPGHLPGVDQIVPGVDFGLESCVVQCGVFQSTSFSFLFAQLQAADQLAVAVDVFFSQVAEQFSALAHKLEQSVSGMKVMLVLFKMFGEILDPVGQQGDLDLRGSGIVFMLLELLNHALFFFDT
jgi:hypothetical protein